LVFENAQFSRAIFSYGAITIEVVRSEVQPEANQRTKSADPFELKRTHFDGEHVERLLFSRDFGERFANVAASDRSLPAGIQHLSQQFSRRGFAVRARDGDDRHLPGAPTQLEFTDGFNFARGKISRQRRSRIDART
jgi:hypothetical protein